MTNDAPELGLSPIARGLESALAALARFSHQRPLIATALLLVAVVVASQQARRLTVDTNLEALLPPSFQSVKDLEVLKERFGSIGYVLVIAEGAEPEALRRFADDLAERAGALPGIAYVNHKRPDDFFRTHALYYLSLEDLEEVTDRIHARIDYEKQKLNPLFVDLTDEGPPSLDFQDILSKYGGGKFAPSERKADPYFINEAARAIAVFVKPEGTASDFRVAKQVIERVEATIAALDPKSYGPELRVRIGGRYKKYQEQQAVVGGDVKLTSALALLFVVAYLFLHFRRVAAVGLLVLPLGVGLVLTFGLAGFLFGVLNILTAFAGSILLGLGIDHGIHLLHRYEHERASGASEERAMDLAFRATGRGVVLAGLTTAIGFFGISFSDFRAFREFGILAGAGVLLVVVVYTLLLPPLLRGFERMPWRGTKPTPKPTATHFLPGLGLGAAPAVFFIATVIGLLLFAQAERARFQYDFAAMDGREVPAYELDEVADSILGHRQTPIVVLTDLEDEAAAAAALRDRAQATGEGSSIDFVVSRADLVPGEQAEKEPLIRALETKARNLDPESLDGETRERFERLLEMLETKPFGREDLPLEIKRQFEPKPGVPDTGTVLAFPSIPTSDGKKVMAMAKEVRDLPLPSGKTVSAAAEAMILADVLNLIFTESPKVSLITMGMVFLSIWILLGRFWVALVCFFPAVLTVFGTLGAVPLLGLEFNYLNLIGLPILFGIAVDAGIHMVLRGADSKDGLVPAILETRGAILGSMLTTAMGFGALLFAHHPGLRSIGQVALIGLALSLAASLIWLTAWLGLRAVRAGRLLELGLAARRADRVAADVSTVFGAGWAARAPGTIGSVAALPFAFLSSHLDSWLRVLVATATFLVTTWFVHLYLRATGHAEDPSEVVVDEFVGVLLALAFVPWSLPAALAGFGLFRLFDIWKPGPVGWCDRNVGGAWGVMLDDVLAGLMAGGVLWGLVRWLG